MRERELHSGLRYPIVVKYTHIDVLKYPGGDFLKRLVKESVSFVNDEVRQVGETNPI